VSSLGELLDLGFGELVGDDVLAAINFEARGEEVGLELNGDEIGVVLGLEFNDDVELLRDLTSSFKFLNLPIAITVLIPCCYELNDSEMNYPTFHFFFA